MTYSRLLSSKYPKRIAGPLFSKAVLLAEELQVVDVDVVGGAGDVDLELDAVELRRRDVRLVGRAPVRQLLHALERKAVELPVVGEDDVRPEVVEALGADAAVRIGVRVRHLQPHLPGRVGPLLGPERDP